MQVLLRLFVATTISLALNTSVNGEELTFKQAYQRYTEAFENKNAELTEQYGQLAYELGKSKFEKGSQNLTALAINYIDALAARKNYVEAYHLSIEIADWLADLHGDDSYEFIENELKTLE